jgi:hypothetical protein
MHVELCLPRELDDDARGLRPGRRRADAADGAVLDLLLGGHP